jgi:3D (Asp-Asp-Asp) domain-containing protein
MKELNAILGLRSDPAPSGADAAGPAPPPAAPEPTHGARPPFRIPRRTGYAILFLLAACATASTPTREPEPLAPPLTAEERALSFLLEAPAAEELKRPLNLWATHYHTPSITPAAATISAAFPLIGRNDQPISPPLLHRDWCEAALQGSVSIKQGGKATAYVFVDSKGPEQANCDQWLGSLSDGVKNATRRARFMKVNHPLGCGVRNHPLVPFSLVHDGYLFAGDRGGAIKGAHIDVFLVESAAGPLEDLFASTESRTFKAHVLADDHPGATAVRATQSASCEPVTSDR